MSKTKQKEVLIEEMGVHFEKKYSIPPLAARVYALLILTEKDGLTFEDCLVKRGASKSSISTSLNLLLKMAMINYFTKSGDRKRYFKLAEKNTFFLDKLTENLRDIDEEREILNKIITYNKEFNAKKYKENSSKTNIFLNYLEENEKLLNTTIKAIKNLHNQ